MGDDELQRRILARRARLIAAALAVGGVAAGADACSFQACLSPQDPFPTPKDAASDAPLDAPQPCLTAPPPDAGDDGEAGPDGSADGSADGSDPADAGNG